MEEKRIADYEVFPSVVRSGENSSIAIKPRGEHARFIDEFKYIITFIPMEGRNVKYEPGVSERKKYDTLETSPQNGTISFTYCFTGEQEWSVTIKEKDSRNCEKVFHIYSLLPDLHGKKAYKGDLHIHSNKSDGAEEPAIVAANYRKAGFDFMAITDHHRWYPSKEAIDKYKGVDIDLKMFFGEEVHVPDNYIHMVNFGGQISVNELYENNKQQIDEEISRAAENISAPEGVNALEYSYRKWIVDNIRKGSGLAILVHPFWIWDHVYNMQTKMTEYMFETQYYDAFELLGGQTAFENNMQTALYYEQRARGRSIPIVGSSDSHGTEPPVWFNSIKTILFSEDLELDSICKNIKSLYSAAVANTGEGMRVDGPFRMVKYAMFLLKYYFPRHDELCFEEGVLMKNYACGDRTAGKLLELYAGRTAEFADKFFGTT